MRSLITAAVLILTMGVPTMAIDDKIADRLWSSSKVLDELMNAPDGGVPKDLLKKAECVAVIPGVKKAAIGFGGQFGYGAATCRKEQGKGPFGPPVMISIKGGSFGLQLGGQSTDVVMLFMTPDSMKYLLRDKVTLGGDASAAAGPKGRDATVATDITMRAEILSYSRSRGLFAGISLEGSTLRPDNDGNKRLYGKGITAKDIVINSAIRPPASAKLLLATLNKESPRNKSGK